MMFSIWINNNEFNQTAIMCMPINLDFGETKTDKWICSLFYGHQPHEQQRRRNAELLTNNFVPLVDVICAGEQYTAPNHFAHNTADWPDVYILCVAHA